MGFKFCPTATECLVYLEKKIAGKPLPCEGVVTERNPYDLKQLDDIFCATEKKDLFFFTKLQRRSKVCSHVNRSVGKGIWHGDQVRKIKNEHGFIEGTGSRFSYIEKGSANNKRLQMTEYSLLASASYNPLKDWVICHDKKNIRWPGRKKIGKSAESLLLGQEGPTAEVSSSTSVVAECSYKNEFEAVPVKNLPASMGDEDPFFGAIIALPDGNDEFLEYLLDLPVAFDTESPAENPSSSSAAASESYTCAVEATPINNLPPFTDMGAEFPPLQSLVALEDGDNQLLDTIQSMNYNIDNNIHSWDVSGFFNVEHEYCHDQLLQFTPTFMN